MDKEEGEEVQAEDVEDIFNKVIAENVSNLEKGDSLRNRRVLRP
jgi:hypothetical protein